MKKAVVVDLDECLVRTNTFRSYGQFAVREALSCFRLDVLFALLFWAAARKCRCVSHERMKYRMLRKTRLFMTDARLHALADSLCARADARIVAFLARRRGEGYLLFLATAAPESYAAIVAARMGFDGYCATPVPREKNEVWKENAREEKCKNTLSALRAADAEPAILLTDHYDDLPLLRIEKERNYLIAPSSETVRRCRAEGICFYTEKEL